MADAAAPAATDILSQDDLEVLAVQYQRAVGVAGGTVTTSDSAAFDAHVSSVLHTLAEQLTAASSDDVLRRVDTIAAKHALTDVVLQRACTSLVHAASSKETAHLQRAAREASGLLTHVLEQRKTLHTALLQHVKSYASSCDAAVKQLHGSLQGMEKENAQLIGAAEQMESEVARLNAAVSALVCVNQQQAHSACVQKDREAAAAAQRAAELERDLATLRDEVAALRTAVQQVPALPSAPSLLPVQLQSGGTAATSDVVHTTSTTLSAISERVSPVAAVLARGVSFVSVNTDDGDSVSSQPSTKARGAAPPAPQQRTQRRAAAGSSSGSYMKPTQSWRAHHFIGGGTAAAPRPAAAAAPARPASPSDMSARDRVMQLLLPMGASSPAIPIGGASGSSSPRSSVTGDGGDFKMLSLKALKDAMDALYSSKARYDAKCASARMPRETLEAHLYTWLNTRFGIRALVLEQARSIIASVDYYTPYDNDVAVFGAILRNEVDEEFRLVQAQLKETARELLRLQLKAAHSMAGDIDLAAMLAVRMGGSSVLGSSAGEGQPAGVVEREWREIVQHMYSPADAALLLPLLRNAVVRLAVATSRGLCTRISTLVPPGAGSASSTPPGSPRSKAGDAGILIVHEDAVREALARLPPDAVAALMSRSNPAGLLPWDVLLKVLLDFQFAGHVRFLAPLRQLFGIVDAAGAGSISIDDFKRVLHGLSPLRTPAELAALQKAADPNGTGMITFSDCVAAAARELAARVRHTGATITSDSMSAAHAVATAPTHGAFLTGGAAAFGSEISMLRQPSRATLARPPSAAAASFSRR